MAAAEDISIANRALAIIGANEITDFTDTSTEGVFINEIYEPLVEAILGASRWSFAKKAEALVVNETAPLAVWNAKYDRPATEVLIVHRLLEGDVKIQFEEFFDGYYCNASSTSTVVLIYGYRAVSSLWPPVFEQAFVYQLAAVCSAGLAEDKSAAKAWGDLAEAMFKRARKVYAQGQTSRKFDTSLFLQTRRS